MVEIVAGKQRAPVAAGVYNVYTGELADTATPTAARMGLEPPRFCAQCGRRM
ncbi:biotin synthase auxiliary protein BsaP, partial [Mycobacterium tuberculosis]